MRREEGRRPSRQTLTVCIIPGIVRTTGREEAEITHINPDVRLLSSPHAAAASI